MLSEVIITVLFTHLNITFAHCRIIHFSTTFFMTGKACSVKKRSRSLIKGRNCKEKVQFFLGTLLQTVFFVQDLKAVLPAFFEEAWEPV